ncbi:MAG: hypothetical protein P1U89_01885 [Verrucomicrobiales bacterium]|nr:hypothetical protein [Verrucomicrobiales bacterium]
MKLVPFFFLLVNCVVTTAFAEFKAASVIVDITPQTFPVLVNGGMLSRSVDTVHTPLSARSLAVSDGNESIVIVVVDSCMVPRPLCDQAKSIASEKAGIPMDHILISATHTHSAPSCLSCLGTEADPVYSPFLVKKLVDAILTPLKNLEPAKVGFGRIDAAEFTALRRWVRRPDRLDLDPFGNPTVRANMHSAKNYDDVIGKSGPEDPELSMIALQSTDGRPIALLANFSMHYFGDKSLSADYFGLFCNALQKKVQPEPGDERPFVGILSHGCSGDIWRRDYEKPVDEQFNHPKIEDYTEALLELAFKAYQDIDYTIPEDVKMAEQRMTLNYRTPNAQLLEWSQRIVDEMGDRPPKTKVEVYAREQIILHERQNTEIVVQALSIGKDIAIATTPNETYAITGLKIKGASPFSDTMVIELANGGDGYIPPPEQHLIGGYNTWAARSAGLEVKAEPVITETGIQLLEKLAGKPRRSTAQPDGPAANAILTAKLLAYWRLDELSGPRAVDRSGNQNDAIYEPQVLFYLPGPKSEEFCGKGIINRSAHFAGHRLRSSFPDLRNDYSITLWFWNGMPTNARDVTGWLFSRDREHVVSEYGEHVGLGGLHSNAEGKLIYLPGNDMEKAVVGKTPIERWTWNELKFVRKGNNVSIYLNGVEEISQESKANFPDDLTRLFFGGRGDNDSNFEGRLDEISVSQP